MDKIDLSNPVLAVALLTQNISELEGVLAKEGEATAELRDQLGECLRKRGGLLMAMGDKEGAESDMKRFLELNPEKIGELTGRFDAEGIEHCR